MADVQVLRPESVSSCVKNDEHEVLMPLGTRDFLSKLEMLKIEAWLGETYTLCECNGGEEGNDGE